MRKVFQNELVNIQTSLVSIAELVKESFSQASTAFIQSDAELAEEVLTHGSKISTKCAELDVNAINLLATQSPVASDLRLIVSALRISACLERMGDLAEHIANLVQYRFPEKATPKGLKKKFQKMGELDVEIAGLVVAALKNQDLVQFADFEDVDDQIDELHKEIFDRVLTAKTPLESSRVIDATLASRYHERFGDQAVNIAKHLNEL